MEEEAGPDVLVSSVYGGRFYIKVMRASDDTNTSYYFEGLAFTGAEKCKFITFSKNKHNSFWILTIFNIF